MSNINTSSVLRSDLSKRKEFEFACANHKLTLGKTTKIMGILNVSSDSFSQDSIYEDPKRAKDAALKMAEDGADIIDIGAESTRPGAEPVGQEEELARVIPVIKLLAREIKVPISIDTTKSAVAQEALGEGASIVNDISGLKRDAQMGSVVAHFGAGCVLMHIKGTPQTMQDNPVYSFLIDEIIDSLKESISEAKASGINRENIAVDPGIGFGKTTEHNLQIIKKLNEFNCLELPILIGTSRKSFIGNVLNLPVDRRLLGTAASVAVAILNGAHIVRVHDVKEMLEVTKIVDIILNS